MLKSIQKTKLKPRSNLNPLNQYYRSKVVIEEKDEVAEDNPNPIGESQYEQINISEIERDSGEQPSESTNVKESISESQVNQYDIIEEVDQQQERDLETVKTEKDIIIDELMEILKEAEVLKNEGSQFFNESKGQTDPTIVWRKAEEKFIKSSEKLLTRASDFVKFEEVAELYKEAMINALMNSGMMMLKLENFAQCIDVLKFAKQFFNEDDTSPKLLKLKYRMAASYNGIKKYKEALEILEVLKNEKDPLIKIEYNKAQAALKEEQKATESEKETYAKMFNPDKRKEEKKKRKEVKTERQVKDTNGMLS